MKKKMTDEMWEVVQAGEYELDELSECYCTFDWDENMDPQHSGNECWTEVVAKVDGEIVATWSEENGFAWEIYPEMEMPGVQEALDDMENYMKRHHSGENPCHEKSEREALVKHLRALVYRGAALYRDPQLGFANQYKSILVMPDAEGPDDDELIPQSPEEWADDYLYNGDAVTEAYHSYEVIY